MHSDIFRIPSQPCPHCGRKTDAVREAPDGTPPRSPRSGDFTVCVGCCQPAVWQVGPLGPVLRLPTAEESVEFAVDYQHHADNIRAFNLRMGYQ